jgi:hypothetical protein
VVTKELIKTEIDKVREEYLPVLLKIVRSLEEPSDRSSRIDDEQEWKAFVAETYGSMSDSPIERADQGGFERREPFS